MTAPVIRPATEDDLPAITAIVNAAITGTTADWNTEPETVEHRGAWLAARRAAGLPVLVATSGDAVVGYASYAPFRDRAGYALTVEHSVYVLETAQSRGAGTALMNALTEAAREAGMHAMVGALDANNEQSLRFHERLGFTIVGRLPQAGHKFGRWLDLVLVQLLLDGRSAPPSGRPA